MFANSTFVAQWNAYANNDNDNDKNAQKKKRTNMMEILFNSKQISSLLIPLTIDTRQMQST